MTPNGIRAHGSRVAGDNDRDRIEILAVGLHGVSRRLTRATVGKEGREPLRPRNICIPRGIRHGRQYFMENVDYPRFAVRAEFYWQIT